MSPIRRALHFGRRFGGSRAPEHAARARAVRARDHLEKKRDRERRRLERARARHETNVVRRRMLRVAAPVGFVLAIVLGNALARPFAEWLWLADRPVERVAVQGARALSANTIAAAAGAWAGQPLAEIEPEAVVEALQADPWILQARALRLPSGTLVVDVVERRAVARWRRADRTELVDPSGLRFAGAVEPAKALPLVEGDTLGGGETLPIAALEILESLATHPAFGTPAGAMTHVRLHLPRAAANRTGERTRVGGPSASAEAHEELPGTRGYVLELGAGGPRALLGRQHFAQRVARLAMLLEEETDAVADARWIDLRYADRAVLRTESASG